LTIYILAISYIQIPSIFGPLTANKQFSQYEKTIIFPGIAATYAGNRV
jgi:hypothetical protein